MEEKNKYIIIGTKIEALILESGITQADLARSISVSPATVSSWVSGERRPGRDNAISLGKYFNKPKEYFEMPDEKSDDVKKITSNNVQYDIISKKIAAGYFDVIRQLAKLRDEGKITEETFNKSLDKLDS